MEEKIFWMDTGVQILGAVAVIVVAAVKARKGFAYHLAARIASNVVLTVATAYVDKVKAANAAQTGSHKLTPEQVEEAKTQAKNMLLDEAMRFDDSSHPVLAPLTQIAKDPEKAEKLIEQAVTKLAKERQKHGARGGAR